MILSEKAENWAIPGFWLVTSQFTLLACQMIPAGSYWNLLSTSINTENDIQPAAKMSTSALLPKTYSSLRTDLRHQESKTEIALAELSSLTNSPPSQQDIQIEDTLLELFAQRRETIDSMTRVLDNEASSGAGGGARVHQVARAREILVEHEKEFRRMKVYHPPLVCVRLGGVYRGHGLMVVGDPTD
jgi:hypothetical protein